MKSHSFLIAALAIPASIAFAQTPSTPTTESSLPYIPLTGTAGGGGNATAMTWFIDVANKQVVACSQSAAGGGNTQANFTCTTQAIPAPAAPPTPTPTPAPATGG